MMAYQRLHFRSLFLHLGTHRLGRRASGASISKRLLCSYDCESLFGYSWQHPESNISSNIASKVGANLHLRQGHPLNIVKKIIEDHYITLDPEYQVFDNLEPLVSTEANFDSLLIPGDHVSRSKSDTYYLRNDAVLRTHTSAHQVELLRQGKKKFLVTGDVYR
jgi:phenylalanyl-tRNA synthetase alpha chain